MSKSDKNAHVGPLQPDRVVIDGHEGYQVMIRDQTTIRETEATIVRDVVRDVIKLPETDKGWRMWAVEVAARSGVYRDGPGLINHAGTILDYVTNGVIPKEASK